MQFGGPGTALRALVGAAALAGVLGPSAGCDGDDAVAELRERSGDVKGQSERGADWEEARVGASFAVGGAVETGADASARVALEAEGSALRLGGQSRVRFGEKEGEVGLEIGGAEVEAGEEGEVVIGAEAGEATVEPDSRVRVEVDEEGGLRFDVRVGRATVEERGEEPRDLAQGETAELESPREGERGEEERADAEAAREGGEAAEDADAGDVRADVSGGGARVRVAGGAWERLEAGRGRVPAGAEIRLDANTDVELVRDDGSAHIAGEAEVEVGEPGGELARARRGRGAVEAEDGRLVLEVPGGQIVVRGDREPSRAEFDVGSEGAEVEGAGGRVDVSGGGGDRRSLGPGERAEIGDDGRVRRAGDRAAEGESPAEADSEPRGPERADFSLRRGESAVVHAPDPPVAIRVPPAPACEGGGVLEVSRRSDFEELLPANRVDAIARMRAGANHYRVRCEDEERARLRGVVRVRRNPGTAPLPEHPPATTMEADGRHYTVHYQNLLPRLKFRWPGAPADEVSLYIRERGGETRRAEAPGGERALPSGALDEGAYSFWMEASGGEGARTPKTPFAIEFDNAADSAHVREPDVGASWNRSAVRVRGVALEDWRVWAGGERLEIDRHNRFSGTVSVPAEDRALAIRFAHPERGVHYYLRRPGG